MQLIASKVFIIFLYIAIGFAANKLRILGTESFDFTSLQHYDSLPFDLFNLRPIYMP